MVNHKIFSFEIKRQAKKKKKKKSKKRSFRVMSERFCHALELKLLEHLWGFCHALELKLLEHLWDHRSAYYMFIFFGIIQTMVVT